MRDRAKRDKDLIWSLGFRCIPPTLATLFHYLLPNYKAKMLRLYLSVYVCKCVCMRLTVSSITENAIEVDTKVFKVHCV